MMRQICGGIFTLIVLGLATPATAQNAAPVTLEWANFESVRDRVRPKPEEIGWQEIPWRGDFAEAVAEASRKELPLLIWAMNGDPLGCT